MKERLENLPTLRVDPDSKIPFNYRRKTIGQKSFRYGVL